MSPSTTLLDLTLPQLTTLLADLGEPAYRARQLWQAIYRRLVTDYAEITELPAALRARLAELMPLSPLTPAYEQRSDDQATKVLLAARDGRLIEAVLMRYPQRTTLCLSSQLGCAVGCLFCQTGLSGFDRHLTSGEMVGQLLTLTRLARAEGRTVTNIVLMGMGEPLLNYTVLLDFIQRTTDPAGFGLGARHITVSTAGVAPRIRQLADEPFQVNLAISLHAAEDELRSRLVPLNRRYPLAELMAASRAYLERTHRRISFEYTLIRDLNDQPRHTQQLASLLWGLLCHVNLIPLNPIDANLAEPEPAVVTAFAERLNRLGIPATIRYSRGRGVAAACGQLRAHHEPGLATPAPLPVHRHQ